MESAGTTRNLHITLSDIGSEFYEKKGKLYEGYYSIDKDSKNIWSKVSDPRFKIRITQDPNRQTKKDSVAIFSGPATDRFPIYRYNYTVDYDSEIVIR